MVESLPAKASPVQTDDESLICYDDARAAQLLGCSIRHIGNLRAAGHLPFLRLGVKKIVIRRVDLLAYLDRCKTGGWKVPAGTTAPPDPKRRRARGAAPTPKRRLGAS
jgi:excisionase family DNA binding protein